MKKDELKIKNLKIKSFVTSVKETELKGLKGGGFCDFTCPVVVCIMDER